MNTKTIGFHGEDVASRFIEKQGLKILARNYSPKTNFQGGEIDIIAKRGETVHFIEVKSRSTDTFGLGREAVTGKKQKTIRRIAERWLLENNLYDKTWVSFDVVEIMERNGTPAIEFFENCF